MLGDLVSESGLLSYTMAGRTVFVLESGYQGPSQQHSSPVLPLELHLLALRMANTVCPGGKRFVRWHFLSALTFGNNPSEPVLQQLWRERPEKDRRRVNHKEFSWFTQGFLKLSFEFCSSWSLLIPSLSLDPLHLFIQKS